MGFTSDFAGYYPGHNFGCTGCGQSAKIHTFLFGPQVSVPIGRITPFGRFLFGDTHMTTFEDGVMLDAARKMRPEDNAARYEKLAKTGF